jgi:two-component system, sensor histidine kinase
MKILGLITKWWKDLSVSTKLYTVVGIMATLIAGELFTLLFAMDTLSAVRAFVGGEGLWSKAQKNAVHNLEKYAITREEVFYLQYLEELKVPLGDRRARLEMEKKDMDIEKVKEGFIAGKNHPDDILPMVHLMRRFHKISYLAQAINAWKAADGKIDELLRLGEELHRQKNTSRTKTNEILNEVYRLNIQLTQVENHFSSTLGEASRWLESLLVLCLVLAVMTIEGSGLLLTIIFSRSLAKTLNELNRAAVRVSEGNFEQQIKVSSSDELGQLAGAINKMILDLKQQTSERQHAEHVSQVKNLFLANMSHEIRTPLNAILGFAGLMRDQEVSKKELAQYLDIIVRTGNNLATIINDILDLTKVEAEQLGVEKSIFSLSQMMKDLYLLLLMRSDEKGITMHFRKKGDIAEYICSDPLRLRQILTNIIGNAIKFTDKGEVTVTYEVKDKFLLVTVQDSGRGVTQDQLDNLFKPFSQGDYSIRKKYGGTGLGLILSRNLAQLLGGDVGLLESRPGTGSTFYAKVLYEPHQNGAHKKKSNLEEDHREFLKNKNILVVEDTQDNQLLLSLYLNKYGAQVDLANNGDEGVQKALAKNYDLILMDMQMPVKDGYSATKELRDKGNQVPIIALTGYAMKGDREKCLKMGCTDYLTKPIHRDDLIHLLISYATTGLKNSA